MSDPGEGGPGPARVERLDDGRRGVGDFVGALDSIHPPGTWPRWTRPLPALDRHVLSRKHPFWENGERALFLARRDGRVVGRVAAIENRAHNRRHGDRTGFFGFFDAVDDPDVSRHLLEAARGWLEGRGLDRIRGPVSPSMHYEAGCLVDGFDRPNRFLTGWSPPYYAEHLEEAGLDAARDLLAMMARDDLELPPSVERGAAAARDRGRIHFVDLESGGYGAGAEALRALYNEAWEEEWGFVPIPPDEFAGFALAGRYLRVPGLGFFAEVDGERVGFALVLPDYNELLRGSGRLGRSLPVALPRMLLHRRRIRVGRIILLGLREAFRGSRLLPLFVHEIFRRSVEAGLVAAEASWILEGDLMHRALDGLGLPVTKRWRIYEGPV